VWLGQAFNENCHCVVLAFGSVDVQEKEKYFSKSLEPWIHFSGDGSDYDNMLTDFE